ncbi:unnamed protein product [Meloidogyne enterolobii]|uniref:Uncharacterized protein n=1 Tax=Meloidogyne enterolobii TaxID=390850 RepID=A0ACB1ABL9_MELEN
MQGCSIYYLKISIGPVMAPSNPPQGHLRNVFVLVLLYEVALLFVSKPFFQQKRQFIIRKY